MDELKALIILKSAYRLNSYSRILNIDNQMLEDAIQELEYLQSKNIKCANCEYYGLGNCILLREVELQSGLYGDGWVEIDNPNENYCADFEKKKQ